MASSSSALLSPPNSPRDHRHYIPRRPSPLSLPPVAPHVSFASTSFSDAGNNPSGTTTGYYQPFSLTEFAVSTPRTSGVVKVPRYPLEKQRRALKDLETEHRERMRKQQMQRQNPMVVPMITTTAASSSDSTGYEVSPQDILPSPTTTLPLTPRSAASSVSSYSQHEDDSNQKSRAKGGSGPSSLCATLFGSCFAAFAISSRRLESMNMTNVRTIASAR